MNDSELKSKLKSISVPERAEAYWENFPSRVRINLHRAAPRPELNESYFPQFAWKFAGGFACIAIGLLVLNEPLKAVSNAVFQKEKSIRRQLAVLPGHLRMLMADEHGLHYLIAEKE